ncbi:MAG: transglutaminase family protein [Prolixibacteraceae bacterium]
MKKRKLQALMQLLDDPDNEVFEVVEKELLKENHEIIPALEDTWENSFDENCQERIENLIQSLQFKQTKKILKNWIRTPENNLLDGFLSVDRFQYPDLNQLIVFEKTEKIKNSIWLELNNSLTLLEKCTILNHFLFNINGLSINHNNIESPQNCFLNQLLETKKGNAVSVSIFYTILARKLEIPARFVDFPRNPLVGIVDRKLAKKVHGKSSGSDVLFYINASNKGAIASRKEIDYHLKKNNYRNTAKFTEPKPDTLFIQRLVESLRNSYRSVGFTEKEARVKELLKLFR